MGNGGDFNTAKYANHAKGEKGKRERLNPPSPAASTRRQGYPLTPYLTREPVRTGILPGDFACFTRAASRAVTRAVVRDSPKFKVWNSGERRRGAGQFAEAGSALSLSMAGCWIAEEEATSP